MRSLPHDRVPGLALALGICLAFAATVHGQTQPKLVAPVYTGAGSLGCSGGDTAVSCAFGTKDPLDKVKAYYDKAVGGLHEAKNGYVMVLRSGRAVEGEGTYSTVFATARIETRPAVTMPPANDPKTDAVVGKFKYLSVVANQIGWSRGGHTFTQEELKTTGMRAPAEFTKVFQQYRHLESSFFPGEQVDELRKRYDAKVQAISERYHQEAERSGKRQQSNFDQMMKQQRSQQQDAQRKAQEDCKRGPTAQQKADHEELKRIIRKNSAERYKRFMAATQKMEKAGCDAPMTMGSPAMEAGMEIGRILEEDPEAKAYAEKMQQRDAASRPRNTAADAALQEGQAQRGMLPREMNEKWQAGLEYLAALDKIHSRTRITISGEKFGADGGGIVTDRAKVEQQWANRKQGAVAEDDESDSGGKASGPSAGSAGRKSPDAAPAQAGQAPASKQPEKKDGGINTDDALKVGKEGFNALKKLF